MPYQWIKALHVISVFAWMAGMFYLPRLFVYHVDAKIGSELSETLKIMERRLLRVIINPSMIASYLFGIWLIAMNPEILHEKWLHLKFSFVLAMTLVHALLARARRKFAMDKNTHSARYFRILNEVPTLLLIGIVIMVIIRPEF